MYNICSIFVQYLYNICSILIQYLCKTTSWGQLGALHPQWPSISWPPQSYSLKYVTQIYIDHNPNIRSWILISKYRYQPLLKCYIRLGYWGIGSRLKILYTFDALFVIENILQFLYNACMIYFCFFCFKQYLCSMCAIHMQYFWVHRWTVVRLWVVLH